MFPALMTAFFALFGISVVLIFATTGKSADGGGRPPSEAPTSAQIMGPLEEIINKRIAQLDEKLVDLHTRTASQLKVDIDEAEMRLQEVEKNVSAKLAVAAENVPAGAGTPSTAGIPDIKHLVQERMDQFDEKLVDMHTRAAKRLEERLQEIEQSFSAKVGVAAEGAAPPASAEVGPDLKRAMQQRMEQFDEKLIDMHTRAAKRIQEVAAETEKKIITMGEDAGKTMLNRLKELEEKVGRLAGGKQ